ncbi:hypothetical protein C2I19_21330 [Chromobacterium alticapitis]|uniref:Uncharacterized protein n=1 Tax=Chromobacterium alticapitis TaxID=2073169 RepID=A0A2S5DA98_9NEIS|nr:hypothetical protein C2I19_21330 [Chromobacterium alticapitis]
MAVDGAMRWRLFWTASTAGEAGRLWQTPDRGLPLFPFAAEAVSICGGGRILMYRQRVFSGLHAGPGESTGRIVKGLVAMGVLAIDVDLSKTAASTR